MSNAAQSRIATSYSRKANRVFLACLIIFWLGAGLFVVSSQANRKNETGPALTGAALNATRDNTGEVKSAKPISTFKIPDVSKPSWPHPVIAGGKLYLREQDKLLCYKLK